MSAHRTSGGWQVGTRAHVQTLHACHSPRQSYLVVLWLGADAGPAPHDSDHLLGAGGKCHPATVVVAYATGRRVGALVSSRCVFRPFARRAWAGVCKCSDSRGSALGNVALASWRLHLSGGEA
eukprot:2797396-Heterocapsa_arctica.AAC.1